MKQTAMQEANEMFLNSRSDEFYGWFWNNRDRLLELEMKQIVEAHGDKLKKSQDTFISIITFIASIKLGLINYFKN
jgi:hypothetical protein